MFDPNEVDITGCLSPFKGTQPCCVRLPDNDDRWVAVFSTQKRLEKTCLELCISDYNIKQITNGSDFISSILEAGLRIMLNPYLVIEENKTKWTEITLKD